VQSDITRITGYNTRYNRWKQIGN